MDTNSFNIVPFEAYTRKVNTNTVNISQQRTTQEIREIIEASPNVILLKNYNQAPLISLFQKLVSEGYQASNTLSLQGDIIATTEKRSTEESQAIHSYLNELEARINSLEIQELIDFARKCMYHSKGKAA